MSTSLAAFDDFSSGGFAGGFGWSGAWTIGGDVSRSSVDNFPTPPQARIGAGATLSRALPLPAGSTGVMLQFQAKASQFGPADLVAVQVSRDGGAFTTLKTFTVDDSNDSYQFYGGTVGDGRITLSWYPATAANMQLRFASTSSTGVLFVDDIRVSALLAPPGLPVPPTGELPVANAGTDTTVDDNDNDNDGVETVTLDGTGSFDPDGTIASYQWDEVTAEGTFAIGSGVTLTASFGHGSHIVQLTMTDNDGGSASDTVVVTVNQVFPNNLPPVANAGPDQTIVDTDGNTLEVVSFDGSASVDPDGTIVSYNWTRNGNPFNNAATFSVTLPIGVHTVDLTVTDDQGATSTDTVVVTVEANTPPPLPTVNSFSVSPTAITAGESANLSSITDGADSVTIDNGVGAVSTSASATVTPSVTTTYTLTATNTSGSATASVAVTVNAASNEALTITQFEFRTGKNQWRIAGTSSIAGPGNTMTIFVGPTVTGTFLGTADVDGCGVWQFREKNSSVLPDSTGTISIQSSQGGTWEGISGTGPVPGGDPAPPPPPPAPTATLGADPASILTGASSTLSWSSTGADSCSAPWTASTAASGSQIVTPGAPMAYDIICTGAGGTVSASVTVTVSTTPPPPPAPTATLGTDPASIFTGESSTLSWSSADADACSASWTASTAASGSQIVTPGATMTYDITCTGAGGSVSASVTVTVSAAPPPPADANLDVAITAPAPAVDGDEFNVSAVISDLSGNGIVQHEVWTFGFRLISHPGISN